MNGWSPSTSEAAVDALLGSIRQTIVTVTGSSLVGLYLFGLLATGDFDAAVSDIDLLAVLADPPNERLAAHLGRMHADLAQANPAWDDRIEVVYISTPGLANCRTDTTTIAVISTGEPFHVMKTGPDWILNWYPARQDAVRLLGPPIASLIPPIPSAEYLDQVRRSLVGFTNRIAGVCDPDDVPRAVCDQVRPAPLQACSGIVGAAGVPAVGRPHPSSAWLAPAAARPRRAGRCGDRCGNPLVRDGDGRARTRVMPLTHLKATPRR